LCGAPTVKIGANTNLLDSEVIISFVEYSNEYTRLADPQVTLDSYEIETYSVDIFLPKNLKPAYYTDETVLGGTIPEIVNKNATTGHSIYIPGQIIVEWMQWFNSSYDTYTKELEEYDAKLADWE